MFNGIHTEGVGCPWLSNKENPTAYAVAQKMCPSPTKCALAQNFVSRRPRVGVLVMPSRAVLEGRSPPLQTKSAGLPGITRQRVGLPLKIFDQTLPSSPSKYFVARRPEYLPVAQDWAYRWCAFLPVPRKIVGPPVAQNSGIAESVAQEMDFCADPSPTSGLRALPRLCIRILGPSPRKFARACTENAPPAHPPFPPGPRRRLQQ